MPLLLCLMTALAPVARFPAAEAGGASSVQALEQRLPRPAPPQGHDRFELPPEAAARLQQRLPALWKRLSQRENTRLLVLADAQVLEVWAEGGGAPTFAEVFAHEMATRFSLPGGVRAPGAGAAEALSPAVVLRVLAEPGQSIVDAAAILRSVAKQAPVDAVLLCHGLAETAAGMSPAEFSRHLQQAGDAARELGADVIAVTPWPASSARPEASLGRARPLADVMLETAEDEGWMGIDLGDWLGWFELPPNDAADEAQLFARLADAWKGFFHEAEDGRHTPRASLHQRLGAVLFQRLLTAPVPAPTALAAARATWKGGDSPVLELAFELVNPGAEPAQVTVLPLIAGGWRPLEARPEVRLEPGARQKLAISYVVATGETLPSGEEARLPLLLCIGRQVWLQTLRAPFQPIAVSWEADTVFNQEGRLGSGGQIVNQSGEDILGTWEVEFQGGTQRGDIRLKPGAGMPLEASFEPPPLAAAAQALPMKLTVRLGDLPLTWVRQLVLARNFGLGEAVPLLADTQDTSARVGLSAEADRNQLTLVAEVSGRDALLPAAEGEPAWQIEAWLDARSYGARLEGGSTWPLRAHGTGSGKGRGAVLPVKPWAFGTGYAAIFDPAQFQAGLVALGADRFQIRLTLPRTYLYLHEWALDNGNSQLGLNVRVTLNTASGPRTWSLLPPDPLPNRITSLRVLELDRQGTPRLTLLRR